MASPPADIFPLSERSVWKAKDETLCPYPLKLWGRWKLGSARNIYDSAIAHLLCFVQNEVNAQWMTSVQGEWLHSMKFWGWEYMRRTQWTIQSGSCSPRMGIVLTSSLPHYDVNFKSAVAALWMHLIFYIASLSSITFEYVSGQKISWKSENPGQGHSTKRGHTKIVSNFMVDRTQYWTLAGVIFLTFRDGVISTFLWKCGKHFGWWNRTRFVTSLW